MALTDEEREYHLRLIEDEIKKQEDLLKLFIQDTYPRMTFSEKAGYWSGTIHQQMRWQGESGLDEYAIFTPEWYESTLKFEPDFDKIIDEVFEKYLGTVWSKYEFLKRIGKIQ